MLRGGGGVRHRLYWKHCLLSILLLLFVPLSIQIFLCWVSHLNDPQFYLPPRLRPATSQDCEIGRIKTGGIYIYNLQGLMLTLFYWWELDPFLLTYSFFKAFFLASFCLKCAQRSPWVIEIIYVQNYPGVFTYIEVP